MEYHTVSNHSRKALVVLAGLLLFGLAAQAQTNPCADPHAPRVGLFNSTPSYKAPVELAARLVPVDRFVDSLERLFQGSCLVKDVTIFDDAKNYPTLDGSLFLFVNSMPSFKHMGYVAVSVEFSVVRGIGATDRMPVSVCPVLLEPDDKESDLALKAQGCLDLYKTIVEGISKKSTAH